MKITQINIKDYNQFKNLMLDLTYPKGHEKEDQALDKICFIGQSGTGKTSLLNICKLVLGATFKPNHDDSLQASLNSIAQKQLLKNIQITGYFKDIKTLIEVFDKGNIVWKWYLNLPKPKILYPYILSKSSMWIKIN
ncbi:MAG: hypothetical protein DRR16_25625 [Candidatus Parabeggiatoa sp. nov. 3]|nr:MAG: hypothetical protein DRR00_04915 [Gammaproteobacteria bacterium]RKZ68704.1 MAG: hypothetical protein DRQ99_03005 [Gammaproteobacteria bacterium]RKZ79474.1 MAG: hypothetical protein DRR16_25625 [Gammaproteobacteria bacterium]